MIHHTKQQNKIKAPVNAHFRRLFGSAPIVETIASSDRARSIRSILISSNQLLLYEYCFALTKQHVTSEKRNLSFLTSTDGK